MITDQISEMLTEEHKKHGMRKLCRVTGLSRSTLYNIINGCNFVLNAEFVAGLGALGYTLELKHKDGDRSDRGTQDTE